MKKIIALTLLAGLASVASAQAFQGQHGTYTLQGCYHTKDGVRCDFDYAPKEDNELYWNRDLYEIVTPAGGNLQPSKVAAGGSSWTTSTSVINVYRGVPVKVSALFDLPSSTTSLRILTVEDGRADNVPVRNSAGAVAPAPVSAAPAQAINISGNWNASLTNCKQVKANEVVCTATLRK